MKKMWRVAVVIIIMITIFASFFIFYELFKVSYSPPRKQIAFVNCAYYISPNGTYAVVNVTEVIPLENVELKTEYFDLRVLIEDDWKNVTYKMWVNDKNGILESGDQFFISASGGKITKLILWCNYYTEKFDGMGVLWDSEHGPYVWKAETNPSQFAGIFIL